MRSFGYRLVMDWTLWADDRETRVLREFPTFGDSGPGRWVLQVLFTCVLTSRCVILKLYYSDQSWGWNISWTNWVLLRDQSCHLWCWVPQTAWTWGVSLSHWFWSHLTYGSSLLLTAGTHTRLCVCGVDGLWEPVFCPRWCRTFSCSCTQNSSWPGLNRCDEDRGTTFRTQTCASEEETSLDQLCLVRVRLLSPEF